LLLSFSFPFLTFLRSSPLTPLTSLASKIFLN
jgi:hypothetical protein